MDQDKGCDSVTVIKDLNWDEYFLNIADLVSIKSHCLKAHRAAVIVKDRRIISTGYCGPPKGYPHCKVCSRVGGKTGEKSYTDCPSVHGEANAILQAAIQGQSIKGAVIYLNTCHPCMECSKLIANSEIKRVVYLEEDKQSEAIDKAKEYLKVMKTEYPRSVLLFEIGGRL